MEIPRSALSAQAWHLRPEVYLIAPLTPCCLHNIEGCASRGRVGASRAAANTEVMRKVYDHICWRATSMIDAAPRRAVPAAMDVCIATVALEICHGCVSWYG